MDPSSSTMISQLAIVSESANMLFNAPLHHCSLASAPTMRETSDYPKQACLTGWRSKGLNNESTHLHKYTTMKCFRGSGWLSAFVYTGKCLKNGEVDDMVAVVKCAYTQQDFTNHEDADLLASILGEEEVSQMFKEEINIGLSHTLALIKQPKLDNIDSGSCLSKIVSIALYGAENVSPSADNDDREELMMLVQETRDGEISYKLIK